MLKLTRHLKLIIFLSTLVLALSGCSDSGSDKDNDSDSDSGTTLGSVSINISAADEFAVPPVSGTATGSGSITLNQDTGALSGSITASDLTGAITAAHIHSGLAGTAGGVIVTLEADGTNANQMNVPDGTVLSAEQMVDLLAANYYFNVHTAANGSGELRAQIIPSGYQVLRSTLEGKNAIPTAVNTANSGIAYATINTSTGLLRGNVSNTGLDDATALHVHSAFAGKNGDVIVTLSQDSGNTAFWSIPDSTILTADQLTAFLAGGLYFNVHTPANTSGEARGQIVPAGIQIDRVILSGDNEVPTPVTSAGSGIGYITVNQSTGAIVAHVITTGIADTIAGHIHSGFAGTNGGVEITLTQDASDSSLFDSADGAILSATALTDFLAGKLYFNIHSTTNASGDIRGQIEADGIKVTRDGLDGSQEVPAVTTAASGIGYTTVNETDGSIEANVRTSGVTATAAHIHEAAAGANGGVALGLTQDSGDTDLWSVSGTLSESQLTSFKADGLYFNVHSAANGGGEIRGQINY